MVTVISRSVEETRKLGGEFADGLSVNDIVSVYGELGAGKTQFIKGICTSLGVKQVVNSPTFIIVNEYSSERIKRIFHFDLYRIKTLNEMYDIGFDDYLDSEGLILIEWPELVESILPESTKKVRLSNKSEIENMREITL
ncbi:MAG: tRNA (adenosine(37)-N6)-threonylcarbamoyltransferase complex ATPase subunit type 1 TsaE [Ignavibacteria bacterium]